MSYPILYQAGETNFQHQGLGVLADSISADVSEDLNGKFELDLVYAYNKSMSKLLVNGNIIKADAGNVLKNQRFTIGQVNRTIDGNIAVHAEHVSYISGDLTLKPKTIVFEQDGQGALNQFVNAIKETDHGLTVYSDVTTVSSSTWAVPDFKNPRDVLGGVEGSILDNWGGEYKYDNKHISLLKQRGSYANTVIAYSRNMTSFEQEDSILETVTSIYPVAVISSQSGDATDAVTHTLPELAVDSQYLNRYDHRKTLLVDFSSEFDDKNPYSDSKLRSLANKYIKDNKVGVPKVSMTVSTLDLTKMVADYSASKIERLDLADTVPVYFDKLDIMTDAKVVGSKWNVLKDCYDEYTMGSRKATLGSIIKGSVAEVKSVAEAAKKHAIEALQSANGKNTNYYGNSGDGAPQNPQVGDLWFVKDGENTIIKQWNGTSWVELISTVWQEQFEEELKKELADAKKELDEALAEKDAALVNLEVKIDENETVLAQATQDLADNQCHLAKLEGDLATNAATVANATAQLSLVQGQVSSAVSSANNAVAKADSAVANAGAALQQAQNAHAKSVKSSAVTYQAGASGTSVPTGAWATSIPTVSASQYLWTRTVFTLQDDTATTSYAVSKIGENGAPGANAPIITKVQDQIYLSTSNTVQSGGSWGTSVPTWSSGKYYWSRVATTFDNGTTVYSTPVLDAALNQALVSTLEVQTTAAAMQTTISQHATLIATKASQSSVDGLSGRVSTAETTLTQHAGQIQLKASQTAVDSLTGRVSTSESKITQQAGLITSTVTGITNESLFSIQALKDTTLKHPNYPDMPMVEVNVTSGESYTLSSNRPNGGTATVPITHVWYLQTPSTTPNSNTNGVFEGNSVTLPAISNKAYIVFRTQAAADMFISGEYWLKFEKTPATQSQITQLASDINLRVTKNDVVNQINLSNEGVLISANKLTIETAGNMLQNTAFDAISNLDFWTSTATSGITKNIYVSTVYWYTDSSGNKYNNVVIQNDGLNPSATGEQNQFFYQDVSITNLAPVSFGCKIELIVNSDGSSSSLETRLKFLDANKSEIVSYDGAGITGTSNEVINDKIENKTPPANAKYIRIGVILRGNGAARFSMPMLTRSAKVQQYNPTSGAIYINGNMIVDGAITADAIAANAVIASKIATDAVTATKIEAGAITTIKLAAGAVTAEKITVNNLAAITGNLGTLTAGVIDAAVVTVKNLNAANITSGYLAADRIAANSITSTHINVANLAAISANLGTITAGTINAATVNIININAASITTGTLNADRIGANSITADKIKATSLDLFSNDSYTNIRSDGMRLQSKAHIIFGPWIDVNGNRRSTQGVYIGGFGGGTNHVAFTRSDGTAFMLRAENGMDYGANDNISINDLNIFDSTHFWKGVRVHGNLLTDGYIAMGGSVLESSIQYSKSEGTMNFRIPGGRSGSYYWFNQRAISEGSFDSRSKLSLKNVKGRYEGNALREIVNTDIAEYSYKNDPKRRQLSPIIDDINEIKKYHLPDIINDGESVNLYAMGSLSWLAIKQLAKKLEKIEEKLDAIA